MRLSLILLLTPDISLMFTSLTFRKCLPASAITNVTCSLHLTLPDPSLGHTMARLGPIGSTSRLSRSCPPGRRTSCLDHISRPAPRPIAGGHHQLVHEVDDGSRRLVQVQLRKNVALVASSGRGLASHKGKEFVWSTQASIGRFQAPSPVLRVNSTMRDLADVVMFPEEKFSCVVRQRDPLPGHLEVYSGGAWHWSCKEELGHSFPHRLWSSQLIGVHAEQVVHVARGTLRKQLLHLSAC